MIPRRMNWFKAKKFCRKDGTPLEPNENAWFDTQTGTRHSEIRGQTCPSCHAYYEDQTYMNAEKHDIIMFILFITLMVIAVLVMSLTGFKMAGL